MFRLSRRVESLMPREVHERLAAGDTLLVDVREPSEFAQAHVEGSLNMPLSAFDPTAIPTDRGAIILCCAVGKRSLAAAEACRKAEVAIAGHMEGGLSEWSRIGLKLVR